MSARRLRLRIAPRAQRDFRSIRVRSLAEWGTNQADAYAAVIDRAIELLRDHPHLGAARDDLIPGLRAYPVGRHLLYYRIAGDFVEIVAILHVRQDAGSALREAPTP